MDTFNSITFNVTKLQDTETGLEFYGVKYGEFGQFQETHMSDVMKEIGLVCLKNECDAVLNIKPNRILFVERSKLDAE